MELRYGYAGYAMGMPQKKLGVKTKKRIGFHQAPSLTPPVYSFEELGNLSPEQCLGRFIKSLVWL